MRNFASCLLTVVLAASSPAGEKTSPIPLRYEGLYQTKLLELKEVLGHPEQPPAVGHTAFLSRDGKLGLYAGGGGANIDGKTDESFLSLWDVPIGRPIKEVRIPGKVITSLALSPNGKQALVGLFGSDGKGKDTAELSSWNLETGKALHSFKFPAPKEGQPPEVYLALAYLADGTKALAAGARGTVQHLDLENGKSIGEFRPGKEEGRVCLALLSAGPDKAFLTWGPEVHLWDLGKGQSVRAFKGPKEDVLNLALSADGKTLAASALDGSVRVWNVDKSAEIASLQKAPVNTSLISLAFTGIGNQLVTVWTSIDPATGAPVPATVLLWDPDTKKEKWSHPAKLQGLVPVAVNGKAAILGGGANLFCQWNLAAGIEEKVWGGHKSPITALVSLKDGLISGSQEGHVKFHDATPRHVVAHADAVFAMRLNKGDLFLTASADRTVKLWNAKTAALVQTYKGHTENVTSIVFGPGDAWIASAGGDRVIRTWERETGKPIAVLSGHSEGINALAISPDGKWLATGSDDNSVRLWPVADGKLLKDVDVVILEGHKRQVTSLAFTPDGKHLLSGSQDKTIRVWDVEKQRTAKILEGHQNWISSVLVWNDRAVSTADDFRVIVWDLAKGKVEDVIDLTPYGDCPRSLTLAADGNGFYVGTSGWVVMKFEGRSK